MNVSLEGSSQDDIIHGGFGDDIIQSLGGKDTLTGAVSLPFKDSNNYEIDFLSGGSGQDTFVLGEKGKLFYTEGQDFTYEPFPGEVRIPTGSGSYPGLFITPKDFAILYDFDPENGDKIQIPQGTDVTIRTIKNDGLIKGVAENSNINISEILSPDAYSTTIISTENAELIAVIPFNSEDAFVPAISLDIDTVEFI